LSVKESCTCADVITCTLVITGHFILTQPFEAVVVTFNPQSLAVNARGAKNPYRLTAERLEKKEKLYE
jgi:hypothetical protein